MRASKSQSLNLCRVKKFVEWPRDYTCLKVVNHADMSGHIAQSKGVRVMEGSRDVLAHAFQIEHPSNLDRRYF